MAWRAVVEGQTRGGGQVGSLDGVAKLDRVNEGLTTSRQCFTIGKCNFNKKLMWSETRQRSPYSSTCWNPLHLSAHST